MCVSKDIESNGHIGHNKPILHLREKDESPRGKWIKKSEWKKLISNTNVKRDSLLYALLGTKNLSHFFQK